LKVLVIFLFVVFSYLQYAFWFESGGVADAKILMLKIDEKEKEINSIKVGNRRLIAEVKDLEDGLDAVEERARSLIGMIKEDEVFLRVNPINANSNNSRAVVLD
jgi:cell division protein FtsB